MKRIVLALLVVMASGSFAQSPPPQFKRTDSGLVPVQASVPLFLYVDGNEFRIDSVGFYTSSEEVTVYSYDLVLQAVNDMLVNGVKLWPFGSNPQPGQALKVQADSSVGFGTDATGSPFFDTISANNIAYVTAGGDTVFAARYASGYTFLYNDDGTSTGTGTSQFLLDRLFLDSLQALAGIYAERMRTTAISGNGALGIAAGTGQPINLQSGISGDINFYYGALLYMALDNGMLDGQSRSAIINFLHGVFEDSLIVEGGTGTGYVASDTVNARVVLGIDGDYVSAWSEIGASTNADSVDHVIADMSGISTGNIVYYDGTAITHTAFDVSDSSVAFADSAGAVTHESVQDIIGAMVTGNTETGITVTYQDGDGTLDFVVTGGGGGIFAWAGVDTLAVLIDSTGDTILAVARPSAGKTVIHAEDGDEIIVGDTTAYARAPHGIIAPAYYKGVPGDTATADSALVSKGYVDTWGGETVLLAFRTVLTTPEALTDSVYLQDNVVRGSGVALFRDSTIQASATNEPIILADVPYDFDCDSLIIRYLTNGSIDSMRLFNSDLTAGDPNPDSLFASNTTARTSTTEARIAIAWNRNFTAGEMAKVQFFDALADDNDRTVVFSAHLKGLKR